MERVKLLQKYPRIKKPVRHRRMCKYCLREFLSSDNSKANICPSCSEVVSVKCFCGCGHVIHRSRFEIQLGPVFKYGHGVKGKTYAQIYGTTLPKCGFQKGDQNIAKDPAIGKKISTKLLEGSHWKFTGKNKFRAQSRLEDVAAKFLKGWVRQFSIHPYRVDFAFPEQKKVIEINGCYWHACEICNLTTKQDWTEEARRENKKRKEYLESKGWAVEIVWEHDFDSWISRIDAAPWGFIKASRYHDICCGHRVVGHEGACKNLHGHNYRIHFDCAATRIDDIGRVIDFSVIKEKLCNWLEKNWDHKFLVWVRDPLGPKLVAIDENVVPVPFNPTAEGIAEYLVKVVGVRELVGTHVSLFSCKVEETRKCSATFTLPNDILISHHEEVDQNDL